jgi:aquaporin Z
MVLSLTPIHLVGSPVANLSVNPARSTGPARFVGGRVLEQLRLFRVAPVAEAIPAGLVYRYVFKAKPKAARSSPRGDHWFPAR